MPFLLASIAKKNHFLVGISFIFLKNVVGLTSKAFNTKFKPQSKDGKSSYQVNTFLHFFAN